LNLQGLTINPPFCQDDIQTASAPIRSPVNSCRQSGFPAIIPCSSMGNGYVYGNGWQASNACMRNTGTFIQVVNAVSPPFQKPMQVFLQQNGTVGMD